MRRKVYLVTGAFGYLGKHIAEKLIEREDGSAAEVRTVTGSVNRENPFGERVADFGYDFERPDNMGGAFEGVDTFFNTYWIRFEHGGASFEKALKGTEALAGQAKKAGVRRIVHVSVMNCSEDSELAYFRGKAEAEKIVRGAGISYAILRPSLLFGGADILINNIAWTLRRMPVFPIFGDGRYRLSPMHVADLAEQAVEFGRGDACAAVDMPGPETVEYRQMVEWIAGALGRRRFLVGVPPILGYIGTRVMGLALRDVFVTREEIAALRGGLLCSDAEGRGEILLSEWIEQNIGRLGRRYSSELARRRDRNKDYSKL